MLSPLDVPVSHEHDGTGEEAEKVELNYSVLMVKISFPRNVIFIFFKLFFTIVLK